MISFLSLAHSCLPGVSQQVCFFFGGKGAKEYLGKETDKRINLMLAVRAALLLDI